MTDEWDAKWGEHFQEKKGTKEVRRQVRRRKSHEALMKQYEDDEDYVKV